MFDFSPSVSLAKSLHYLLMLQASCTYTIFWHAQQATGLCVHLETVKTQNNILLLKIGLNGSKKIL